MIIGKALKPAMDEECYPQAKSLNGGMASGKLASARNGYRIGQRYSDDAIVDDNDAVRKAMKLLMRSLGYHASTFGSADEFLNSGQVDDTSFLITDVAMPGLSGIDLQDWLIARVHRMPIIFITAYSDKNVRIRAMKAGAVAFLTKPIDCHHLIDHLQKALKAA